MKGYVAGARPDAACDTDAAVTKGDLRTVLPRFAVGLLALVAGLAGLAQPAPAAAADDLLSGIDVSHYQGEIRWTEVAGAGIGFVIAKATEGRLSSDAEYARNKERAEALGLPFAAYHFAHPEKLANDAVLEADHFLDTAMLNEANLLPVLDLEDHGGLGQRKLRRWVKAWLAEVQSRLGVKAIIYASPSFVKDRLGNSRWFADNGYRLWIAHWHVAAPRVPARNWAGRGWTIWQHDNCGSVPGIDGCVDLDWMRAADLESLRLANNHQTQP